MDITLHSAQSEVFSALFVEKAARHVVVVASRGWGKSYFAATSATQAVFELLALHGGVPNKNVYIVAPTYSQVTDIYHPMLAYQLGLDQYATRHSKDLGIFWFPNDVTLKLVSFEAIERIRGTGAYFVVNDEPSSCTKGIGFKDAWQSIIQPCIATRWSKKRAAHYGAVSPGRSLTIGTPKGFNFLYDMFHYQEVDDEWRSYHFDYKTSPYLDDEEIERIKHTVDPLQFNREYKATFEDSGNNVFYCFDRKAHVTKDIAPLYPPEGNDKGEDVHIAIDFNVGLQCSSAWAIRGNQLHCIDEFKGHPDTETLAKVLAAKYKGHRIYAYPDPSGRARKTSAAVGVTDFTILQSHGIQCLARTKAPPIVDSVAAVNKKLKNAAGEIDVFISPSCPGVIQSLERTSWCDNNSDLAVIDKTEGVEHFSDGIRYLFEYKYPILAGSKPVAKGFGF
jgi:hypothetical protein